MNHATKKRNACTINQSLCNLCIAKLFGLGVCGHIDIYIYIYMLGNLKVFLIYKAKHKHLMQLA